jgi:transketolase
VTKDIERLSIDTIRTLAMDAVQAANSGHPGMPMAMAPAAYLLFQRIMEHNPRDPQ